jgi:putative ABC transport system substrate-binding protein
MSASRTILAGALVLGLLAAPDGAGGQSSGGVRRIGVIHQGGVYAGAVEGLRQGLRELGLEEDRHVVLDIRDTRGDLKAVAGAAKDLERRKVDLIYTVATSVTLAAKGATAQTPIVFFAGTDPVGTGLVESLAKPGGRLTGVHSQATDLTPKRLEVLKEMIPGLARVLTVYNPANPVAGEAIRLAREAARQLGVQFVERHVRSVEELRQALHAIKPREWDAYFYTADAMVASHASLIIDTARVKRLPTMFHEDTLVAKGALASYGTPYRDMGRISAKHVQRILAGASPKDLPVESYDKIEFVLNLRTAREIGLTIPPTVRLLADRVIE